MPIAGEGFELRGVSVGNAGPVKSLLHIPLDTGVSALYGLNGAGKTWVLRLVRSALTGVVTPGIPDAVADVHLRLVNPEQAPYGRVSPGLRDGFARALDQRRGSFRRVVDELSPENWGQTEDVTGKWDEFLELGDRNIGDDLWSNVAAYIDAAGIRPPPGNTEVLSPRTLKALYEAADGGLITLRACGTTTRPAWNVFLPLDPSAQISGQVLQSWAGTWCELLGRIAESDGDVGGVKIDLREPGVGEALENSFPGFGYFRQAAQEGNAGPASWIQVPLLAIDEPFTGAIATVLDHDSTDDVDAETLDWFLAAQLPDQTQDAGGPSTVDGPNPFLSTSAIGLEYSSRFSKWFTEVQGDAVHLLAAVLVGAPALRYNLLDPTHWFVGERPRWEYGVERMAVLPGPETSPRRPRDRSTSYRPRRCSIRERR